MATQRSKIKNVRKSTPIIKTSNSFSSRQVLFVAAVFAVVAGIAVWHSFAASVPANLLRIEGETMTPVGGGSVTTVADPTASGGQAMELLSNHTEIDKTFTTASTVGAYAIRAHATACQGSDALMAVYVDGRAITATSASPGGWVKVSNTNWASATYNVTAELPATHTIRILHSLLPHIDEPCNNPLYIDYVDVQGPKLQPAY